MGSLFRCLFKILLNNAFENDFTLSNYRGRMGECQRESVNSYVNYF